MRPGTTLRILVIFFVTVMISATASAQYSPLCENALNLNGLIVDCPKIYDNYYLRLQLNSLKAQLESIQAVSGASLPSSLGIIQGADVRQTGFAIQAGGGAAPAITNSTAPTGTTNTSTGSALTPSFPAAPAGTLSPPTPGVGSLDRLAEAMQLQYQILNLQMLVDGAVDDKVSPSGTPRRTFTLGFPVTINPPTSGELKGRQDHVAVIRVRLCQVAPAPPSVGPSLVPPPPFLGPSIITLLPKEHTYNVAGIVEKSFSASGGAVLGGVMSVGGGFLHSRKRYNIVQDQETVALQDPSSSCAPLTKGSSFVWEIKPVLGNQQVRSGMQTNFVQFTFDGDTTPKNGDGLLDVCVELGWANRTKAGAVDIPTSARRCSRLTQPKMKPEIKSLTVVNYAGSSVRISAKGRFLPGTHVRVGNAFVNDSSYRLGDDNNSIEVSLSISDLLSGDVSLVGRNGETVPMYVPVGTGTKAVGPIAMTRRTLSDTTTSLFLEFAVPTDEQNTPFPEISCNSETTKGDCKNDQDPWVVVIGGKAYGLMNAPFSICAERNADLRVHCSDQTVPGKGYRAFERNYRTIDLVVPTASLLGDPQLSVQRLLWNPRYGSNTKKLTVDTPTVTKSVSLSSGEGLHLLLMGNHLDDPDLRVRFPEKCGHCFINYEGNGSAAQLILSKKNLVDTKQIVLCRMSGNECDGEFFIMLDIPKDTPVAPTKASLKGTSISTGDMTATLGGDKPDTIVMMSYSGQHLTYHLENGKLVVDLIPVIYSKPGIYPVRAKLVDGTSLSATITVTDKKP